MVWSKIKPMLTACKEYEEKINSVWHPSYTFSEMMNPCNSKLFNLPITCNLYVIFFLLHSICIVLILSQSILYSVVDTINSKLIKWTLGTFLNKYYWNKVLIFKYRKTVSEKVSTKFVIIPLVHFPQSTDIIV